MTARVEERGVDAAVAEKVMGWTRVPLGDVEPVAKCTQCGDCFVWDRGDGPKPHDCFNNNLAQIPAYSRDVAAAWSVVERMSEKGWEPGVNRRNGQWHCWMTPPSTPPDIYDVRSCKWVSRGECFHGYAETMPLAVCTAALAALEKTK